MSSYLVTAVDTRAAKLAPPTPPPVGVPGDTKSRIEAATSASARFHASLDALVDFERLLPRNPIERAFVRSDGPPLIAVIVGGLGTLGAGVAGCLFDYTFLLAVPVSAGLLGLGLRGLGQHMKAYTRAHNRQLDSSDVTATLELLHQASDDERAVMRPQVEQRVSELESNKRITPKAAVALREAVGPDKAPAPELVRAAAIAAFGKACAGPGELPELETLATVLTAASAEERTAAADYLEQLLFPKEVPLSRFQPEYARKLYALIHSAHRGDAPSES